jgi:hypothetical protein
MKADLRDLSIILQNILIYPNQRKAKWKSRREICGSDRSIDDTRTGVE